MVLDKAQVSDIHCKRLRKQNSNPRGSQITLRELASRVGVSTSTASRALNQNTAISEDVRKRVLRAAHEANYVRNSMARSLALRRSHILGLIVPSIANPFFSELARGAHDAAYQRGYVVTLCDTQRSQEREDLYVSTMLQSRMDGVIAAGNVLTAEHIKGLKQQKVSVVFAGRLSPATRDSGVSVDNVLVGSEATEYLIGKGHKNILFLGGAPESPANIDRQRGYEGAMARAELPPTVVSGEYSMECGFNEAARIASLKTRPSAVFAANDLIAIGLIMGLINAGLKVPGDVAVMGCDDIQMSALIKPALTTIHVPMYDIGVRATQLLFQQIENGEQGPPEMILLGCRLVVRESVG
jgi:LacI family transcriptional regulator